MRCSGRGQNKYLSIISPAMCLCSFTTSLERQPKITGVISFFTITNQVMVNTRSLGFSVEEQIVLVKEWIASVEEQIVKIANRMFTKSIRMER